MAFVGLLVTLLSSSGCESRFSSPGSPQDFNSFQARSYTIRNDVAGIWYNELASTVNATWVAKSRIISQKIHGLVDSLHDKPCGLGIVFGNVVGFLVEVLQRFSQPPNLHLLPTSQRSA